MWMRSTPVSPQTRDPIIGGLHPRFFMSITLSKRLAAIARLVPDGARVIDVGTDHARLPVWLAQQGRAAHIFASDIRTGPLEGAAALVDETRTADRVTLRLTDGLSGFTSTDADTVVIAGMGGEAMVEILSASTWVKTGILLILSPQTKQDILRSWLTDEGFGILSESLVEDMGRIYPILTARAGETAVLSAAELHTGRFSLIASDPLFPKWLGQLVRRASAAAPYSDSARYLLNEFKYMKERLETMPTVGEILGFLEQLAPVKAKLDFDNVGLLVGRSNRRVRRVLAALDITDDVIEEAIKARAELIVSHHPLFFELKSVTDGTWTGERALTLAEHKIAAICMHTNLDAARGGVNDALLAALGLSCVGELDDATMIGRIGELPDVMRMDAFLPYVKAALHTNGLRYHDAGIPVRRVAVCGGSGGGEVALAYAAGCDTYVTADIKYDHFLEAKHLGMNLIDADHFCTENVMIPVLRDRLTEAFDGLEVVISGVHGQTAQFY